MRGIYYHVRIVNPMRVCTLPGTVVLPRLPSISGVPYIVPCPFNSGIVHTPFFALLRVIHSPFRYSRPYRYRFNSYHSSAGSEGASKFFNSLATNL